MANGYCPAIIKQIAEIAGGNAPGKKMHAAGFTKSLFCCQNSSASPINDAYPASGHQKTMTIRYRQRPLLTVVDDLDNCDINRIPAYSEWNIPGMLFRKTSFYLSDDEIRKYCEDASNPATLGGQRPTGFMQEHYGIWLEHANVLLKAMNIALVAQMATQFGKNTVTGLATARTFNIKKAGADYDLDAGVIRFLADLKDNEICDELCMVGSGLFANYENLKLAACCSAAGIDMGAWALPGFTFDKDTATGWGTNNFAILAKNSVKMMSRDKYTGAFAGAKGGSIFFNVAFPVNEFNCVDMAQCLRDLSFDVQMRYIDCPTEIMVAGVLTTLNRGWEVILSKNFNLWVMPTTAYAVGDPLAGTNGTLLYNVTNV